MMMKYIVSIALVFVSLTAYAYTPPKGIPDPADSFSTFGEIDQAAPSTATTGNPKCTNWPTAATTGCYYIDPTHGSSSDNSNDLGYPNKPRKTPPNKIYSAGDLIYIHAGSFSAAWYIRGGVGTAANPIWVVGNSSAPPTFTNNIQIGNYVTGVEQATSYVILTDLNFAAGGTTTGRIRISPSINNSPVSNIIVRNCVMTGAGRSNNLPVAGDISDSTAIIVGSNGTTVTNSATTNVVLYNLTISNYGYVGDLGVGSEECGVYWTEYVNGLWILNSTFHGMGSAGMGGCHNCAAAEKTARNIFIGANTSYENGERCMAFKYTDGFIVSENNCYGFHHDEQGWNISAQYATKNGWFLFNRIYHASAGIVTVSAPANENFYFIGNLFYDIKQAYDTNHAPSFDVLDGVAIGCTSCNGDFWIVDNTMYDCDMGVKTTQTATANTVKIHGNIISGRTDAGFNEIYITAGAESYVDMDYNLFQYPSGNATIYWGGASRVLTCIQGTGASPCDTYSECANCIEGDPKFDGASRNLHIASDSPAVGANVEGPVGGTVYDLFATTWTAYGVTIEKDYDGKTRPQNSTWDIGAYEFYDSGGGGGDTTAPTQTACTLLWSSGLTTTVTHTATDAVGVTGYCLSATNSSAACEWTATPSISYTWDAPGAKTLYCFAKDAGQNISTAATATASIPWKVFVVGP
jgi:hypothetical protein